MKTLFLFLSITLLLSCTENKHLIFSNQDKIQEYILPPNEVILNIAWKGTYLYVCTRDTVTNTVYFRSKQHFDANHNEISFKGYKFKQ